MVALLAVSGNPGFRRRCTQDVDLRRIHGGVDDAPTMRQHARAGHATVSGGPGEFEQFFRSRFAEVARAMMLAVRDRDLGEQIAAESFTRLFERWASFETENHALRFAYRTALNLATPLCFASMLRLRADPWMPDF